MAIEPARTNLDRLRSIFPAWSRNHAAEKWRPLVPYAYAHAKRRLFGMPNNHGTTRTARKPATQQRTHWGSSLTGCFMGCVHRTAATRLVLVVCPRHESPCVVRMPNNLHGDAPTSKLPRLLPYAGGRVEEHVPVRIDVDFYASVCVVAAATGWLRVFGMPNTRSAEPEAVTSLNWAAGQKHRSLHFRPHGVHGVQGRRRPQRRPPREDRGRCSACRTRKELRS